MSKGTLEETILKCVEQIDPNSSGKELEIETRYGRFSQESFQPGVERNGFKVLKDKLKDNLKEKATVVNSQEIVETYSSSNKFESICVVKDKEGKTLRYEKKTSREDPCHQPLEHNYYLRVVCSEIVQLKIEESSIDKSKMEIIREKNRVRMTFENTPFVFIDFTKVTEKQPNSDESNIKYEIEPKLNAENLLLTKDVTEKRECIKQYLELIHSIFKKYYEIEQGIKNKKKQARQKRNAQKQVDSDGWQTAK